MNTKHNTPTPSLNKNIKHNTPTITPSHNKNTKHTPTHAQEACTKHTPTPVPTSTPTSQKTPKPDLNTNTKRTPTLQQTPTQQPIKRTHSTSEDAHLTSSPGTVLEGKSIVEKENAVQMKNVSRILIDHILNLLILTF